MMPGMYSAISGLEAHQQMLNVTANNLANVDTIGYKAQRTTFESELSMLLSGGSGQTASNGGTNPEQVGLGVQVGSVDQIMSGGSLATTGNALDVGDPGRRLPGRRHQHCCGRPLRRPAPSSRRWPPATRRLRSTPTAPPPASPQSALPTAISYTRAGNLTTDARGLPDHRERSIRRRLRDPAGGRAGSGSGQQRGSDSHRLDLPVHPAGIDQPLDRAERRAHLYRQQPGRHQLRPDLHRRLPRRRQLPEPGRPDPRRRNRLDRIAQLRSRQLRHSGQRCLHQRRRRSPASSSSPTSTWRPSSRT